jgi:cation diffusion facilitator family transporter
LSVSLYPTVYSILYMETRDLGDTDLKNLLLTESEEISSEDLQIQQDAKEQNLVTKITAMHVFTIFTIKFVTALFSRSMSFFAELTDSILDFIALFITYVGLKESRKKPDYQHMFGHYKINSAAGFAQALLIVGMYFYILYSSLNQLYRYFWLQESYLTSNTLTQAIVLCIALVFVTVDSTIIIRIGKRQQNTLIMAQGANFRGDLYRNISFIVGLIIVSFGFSVVDLILAIIFSIRTIVNGWSLLRQSFNELIDSNTIQQEELDNLRDQIKAIPDVKALDSFAVRTHSNALDARVMVRIDIQKSVLGGALIAEQIRKIIRTKFEGKYRCNVIVQFNTISVKNPRDMDYIFEIIREIAVHDMNISNIHNLSIDDFQDNLLIQFHIDVDSKTTLTEAHKIATTLENTVSIKLKEMMKFTQNIEVISHIEPELDDKKKHSHSIKRPAPEDIQSHIFDVISHVADVKNVKDLRIQNESEGLFLTVKIVLDGNKSIEEVHDITEKVEYALMCNFPDLKRALIHTEPL